MAGGGWTLKPSVWEQVPFTPQEDADMSADSVVALYELCLLTSDGHVIMLCGATLDLLIMLGENGKELTNRDYTSRTVAL